MHGDEDAHAHGDEDAHAHGDEDAHAHGDEDENEDEDAAHAGAERGNVYQRQVVVAVLS